MGVGGCLGSGAIKDHLVGFQLMTIPTGQSHISKFWMTQTESLSSIEFPNALLPTLRQPPPWNPVILQKPVRMLNGNPVCVKRKWWTYVLYFLHCTMQLPMQFNRDIKSKGLLLKLLVILYCSSFYWTTTDKDTLVPKALGCQKKCENHLEIRKSRWT